MIYANLKILEDIQGTLRKRFCLCMILQILQSLKIVTSNLINLSITTEFNRIKNYFVPNKIFGKSSTHII